MFTIDAQYGLLLSVQNMTVMWNVDNLFIYIPVLHELLVVLVVMSLFSGNEFIICTSKKKIFFYINIQST